MKENKICPKCGIEHQKSGKFCSRKCANSRTWSDADKKKKSESNKNSNKIKRNSLIKLTCNFCKKEFVIKYKKKQKFCSKSCATKYHFLDENNRRIVSKKIKDICINLKQKKIDEYNKNPKLCLQCLKPISYKRKHKIYCNTQCHANHKYHVYIKKWLECELNGSRAKDLVSRHIYKYIKERDGHRCLICGLTEWRGKKIGLILDHIDGNPYNNNQYNLRYVCGNCDEQLPTYKSRNIGNGRKNRYT